MVSGVEDTIDSAFGKISTTVDQAGDKVKSEIKALEEDVKSLFDAGEKEKPKDSTIKTEDIDELLNALPTAEETIDAAKTSENVVERIVEEVHQETN